MTGAYRVWRGVIAFSLLTLMARTVLTAFSVSTTIVDVESKNSLQERLIETTSNFPNHTKAGENRTATFFLKKSFLLANDGVPQSISRNEKNVSSATTPPVGNNATKIKVPDNQDNESKSKIIESPSSEKEKSYPRIWCQDNCTAVPKHKKRKVIDMRESFSKKRPSKRPKNPYIDQSMCVPMSKWQVRTRENCNSIHEIELKGASLLGTGGWRSAWKIKKAKVGPASNRTWSFPDEFVLKTTKLQDDLFDKETHYRHFVDAAITGQLTHSSHVVDIYGFCANAALNEVAERKLSSVFKLREEKGNPLSSVELLDYAYQVASSLKDLHSINGSSIPSAAHKDLKPANIVVSKDGSLRLNDFNDAELIKLNTTSNSTCAYRRRRWKANYRSPEELFLLPLSERVDVYALGGIIYHLLMKKHPYSGKSDSETSKSIAKGIKPKLSSKYKKTSDRAYKFLVETMNKCWTYDPKLRPSSREISDLLKKELVAISQTNLTSIDKH